MISVTHRLATIVDADRVFVFQEGRLIEQGRHEELLLIKGLYASLWEKQAGFAADDDGDGVTVTAARLRAIPLLSRLTEDALSKLVQRFDPVRFAEDRVVVQEGDPGDKFYLIVRGKLEVYKDTGHDARKRLEVLADGDFFGEIALLRDLPRTASVRTLAPSLLLSLSRKAFLETLTDTPELRDELERAVAERT